MLVFQVQQMHSTYRLQNLQQVKWSIKYTLNQIDVAEAFMISPPQVNQHASALRECVEVK